MNEGNYFIFRCSSFRRRSGVYIFKVPQGDNKWNSEWKKDTEGVQRHQSYPQLSIYFLQVKREFRNIWENLDFDQN